MTASELALVVAALLCCIGFAALIVVLVRVLDALQAVRSEVDALRAETGTLVRDLLVTTDDARRAMDEARADLERFDQVLGSAEAIGDAVGGRVARTTFSAPVIKAAGLVRGTSRTISRLRGTPPSDAVGPVGTPSIEFRRQAIEAGEAADRQRRKRA